MWGFVVGYLVDFAVSWLKNVRIKLEMVMRGAG